MTLEGAIEILKERYRIRDPLKNPDYEAALKLGIEAMKQTRKLRAIGHLPPGARLPGETRD